MMMMANSTGNTTKADRLEVLGNTATGENEENMNNGVLRVNIIKVHTAVADTHIGGSRWLSSPQRRQSWRWWAMLSGRAAGICARPAATGSPPALLPQGCPSPALQSQQHHKLSENLVLWIPYMLNCVTVLVWYFTSTFPILIHHLHWNISSLSFVYLWREQGLDNDDDEASLCLLKNSNVVVIMMWKTRSWWYDCDHDHHHHYHYQSLSWLCIKNKAMVMMMTITNLMLLKKSHMVKMLMLMVMIILKMPDKHL